MHLLWAEWTKFRTVRAWVVGMAVAAMMTVLFGILAASGIHCSVGPFPGQPVALACSAPLGPDGEAVDDRFSFVHQPLDGNGSITARLTSMSGIITYPPPNHDQIVSGVVPWAKAGIIIKASTEQGSAYAAMMATGSRGVRMQSNFTQDVAGRPDGVSVASPRWLRLTRTGDTLTGYESTDSTQWSTVGTTHLAGLATTVQVGLFVASPCDLTVSQGTLGGSVGACRFTQATAVFDQVNLQGRTSGVWSHISVGDTRRKTDWERYHRPAGVEESAGTFTVTGSGDVAPLGTEGGQTIERTLSGVPIGLIVVTVVAVMFISAEYRRGLIRTTLLASPRGGRVLAAKAVVIGTVTFLTGLAATGVAVPLGKHILRANGNVILPVNALTELRVIIGSAALLAVAAVFALALGALFRRSVAAVTAAITVVTLPYILATASVLPTGAAQWLLRVTPAAGFAIQQSIPTYQQVIDNYAPSAGYYPLMPWVGFAVLCGYTALALGLAIVQLRRRDA
jgi:ABC-type transport system involved in multi-copper enzyme maturation permease subunit